MAESSVSDRSRVISSGAGVDGADMVLGCSAVDAADGRIREVQGRVDGGCAARCPALARRGGEGEQA
jgi:hypothetical protein